MQRYKNYNVYTRAVYANGVWRGKAIVLNSGAEVTKQLKCIETVPDFVFSSRHEAEECALRLCKNWIDKKQKRN